MPGKVDWLARGLPVEGEQQPAVRVNDVVRGDVARALDAEPNATAEQVMEPGPSTVRLDMDAGKLAERLRERNLTTAVATDPEGRLAGIVRLVDLDRIESR